jgi:hypothetical protein
MEPASITCSADAKGMELVGMGTTECSSSSNRGRTDLPVVRKRFQNRGSVQWRGYPKVTHQKRSTRFGFRYLS